jgi:DNA-directed RNA polymerase specialized sigma24 family protein
MVMASPPRRGVTDEIHRLFTTGTVAALDDASLLRQFAIDRDDLAFAALVTRHGPMVLSVCRGVLADPHDAQEAVQATFLALARQAGTVRVDGSLGGWL